LNCAPASADGLLCWKMIVGDPHEKHIASPFPPI
jgi:hypothetical protein